MAIPLAQPGPFRPRGPLLTSTWRRVEDLVPRELLHQTSLEQDGGEDEWEEDEVEYVTLDFAHHLTQDMLAENNAVQLLEPESATPVARIGDRYFEENANPAYRPFTTSSHRIIFQPVALVPPSGPQHAIGVPSAPGRGAGRGRGRGRGSRGGAARATDSPAPPELGPDGQPKRKPGRPRGSKNKPKPFAQERLLARVAGMAGEPAEAAEGEQPRRSGRLDKGKGKERAEEAVEVDPPEEREDAMEE
ncbi:hypothetical protein JCM10450v2_002712 [Rhodotorula kratochvilovae]